MSEYEITVHVGEAMEYVLSANTDTGQFLTAMKNRDEAEEFFVGVRYCTKPVGMQEWEHTMLAAREREVITYHANMGVVHYMFSTRDVFRFEVDINDSDSDY